MPNGSRAYLRKVLTGSKNTPTVWEPFVPSVAIKHRLKDETPTSKALALGYKPPHEFSVFFRIILPGGSGPIDSIRRICH